MAWDLPATGRQCRAIAKLCIFAGIRDEPELRPMTRLEARDMIYQLRTKRSNRSGQKRQRADS